VPPLDAAETDLVAALRRLPLRQREAIVLHHLADLSVQAVAAQLVLPDGTVKSLLSRGRATLARELYGRNQRGGTWSYWVARTPKGYARSRPPTPAPRPTAPRTAPTPTPPCRTGARTAPTGAAPAPGRSLPAS